MDKCELFDLTEALYAYCVLNHSGMHSELYSIQSQISNHYEPSPSFSESEIESDNCFYGEITDDNASRIWTRLEYVLDNHWDDMD